MGARTGYAPGTFSWVDLAAPDLVAATAFYTALFGWDAEDGADGYTTFRRDGAAVCGAREGKPARWDNYVTVTDVDATAAQAAARGATVVDAPADIGDLGRTAVLADPQGAVFSLWQPGTRFGAEWVNDVGSLTMNELVTKDLDAARAFYEHLFGWRTETVDTGPDGPPLAGVYNGETLNANMSVGIGDQPPHWRPYFTVASTEDAVARVQELGGQVVFGPFPIPAGSFAVAFDPQDAIFALFAGEVDP